MTDDDQRIIGGLTARMDELISLNESIRHSRFGGAMKDVSNALGWLLLSVVIGVMVVCIIIYRGALWPLKFVSKTAKWCWEN